MSKILLITLLLLTSSGAYAQSGAAGCPPGMVPGPGRCYGPNELPQQQQETPSYTGPLWQDRYGAVASGNTGAGGVAENMSSARAARKKALHDCGQKGCKVNFEVRNACLVQAWGGGVSGFAGRPDLHEASESAVETCRNAGGVDCKIIYSACSLPVRIR